MKNLAQEETTAASPVGDRRWDVAQRVAASQPFARSSRLRDFLLYICHNALAGRTELLSEYEIGCRVFGRGADYATAEDNIVRVTARQLRTKLREYFDGEGAQEALTIEIPKGGYIPVFAERTRETAPPPDRPSRSRTTIVLAVVAALSLAVNAGLLLRRSSAVQPAQAAEAHMVSALFGSSGRAVPVIVSDSALVLMQTIVGRRFDLDEYSSRIYRKFPPLAPESAHWHRFWDSLSTRQVVNVGDVTTFSRILTALEGRATLVNARSTRARDLKSGNAILLGSDTSNPWSGLFEDGMNFRFRTQWAERSAIANLKPQPGEQSEYVNPVTDRSTGLSYARIALVPNLTNTGRVLLVAGITMEATESAGELALNAAEWPKLRRLLGIRNGEPAPKFELLLETADVDGTGRRARLLAHRVYPTTVP